MIKIHHKNKEIEALVFENESTKYKELLQKKTFMKALRAFYTLMEIIDDMKDLMKYTFLQYKRNNLSSVRITGGSVSKRLVFSEGKDGHSIIILELI